jgi:hypothetical protein
LPTLPIHDRDAAAGHDEKPLIGTAMLVIRSALAVAGCNDHFGGLRTLVGDGDVKAFAKSETSHAALHGNVGTVAVRMTCIPIVRGPNQRRQPRPPLSYDVTVAELRDHPISGTYNASEHFDFNPRPMAQDNIDWQRDVDAAIAQAKRDNKPLLLDFTAAPA